MFLFVVISVWIKCLKLVYQIFQFFFLFLNYFVVVGKIVYLQVFSYDFGLESCCYMCNIKFLDLEQSL